ncbi:NAD(P)-binding domain-containing protein, partial [Acinetobacter baumannii]
GSAGVGQILAKAFYAEGHEVKLGTRDINKQGLESFKQENTDIKVVSFSDAAKFGELLVLAVSGEVVHNAVELAGKENFS